MIDRILQPILGWATTPWRIAALLMLIPLAVSGLLIWEWRGDLGRVLIQSIDEPRFLPEKAQAEAAALLSHGVIVVAIYTASVTANLQTAVIVKQRDGEQLSELIGRGYPFVGINTRTETVRALLSGTPSCFAPSDLSSEHVQVYRAVGVGYVCSLPIPGVAGILVGLLHLGWADKPTDYERDAALVQARLAAQRMARW